MFNIDYKSSKPIYEQIINQMVLFLVEGILKGGDQLPSVRELASSLGINPNTVSKAYGELERRGYTETVKGKGTYVSETHRVRVDLQNQFKETLRNVFDEMQTVGFSNDMIESIVGSVLKEEEYVTNSKS